MAYSTSTPPSSDYADAPMIIVGQALDYAGSHDGRWAASRSMSASDDSLAGFEAALAWDGLWHRLTKPDSDAATWYLNFYADPTQAIDYVAILGHNFASAPSGFAWTLYTADDDAFTSNVVTMASENSGITTKRRVAAMASRYSGVERVSLKIEASGAWRPHLGEIVLGAREHLPLPAREPYDDRAMLSDVRRSRSLGGVVTDVVLERGRRVLTPTFYAASSTERDQLRDVFDGSLHGGRSALWIEHPSSDPGRVLVVSMAPELSVPMVEAPGHWEVALELEERGPLYEVE